MSSTVSLAAPPDASKGLRLLARLVFGFTVLALVASAWLSILDTESQGLDLLMVSFSLFPLVGYVLATRRPENAVSWLTLGVGAALGLSGLFSAYASYAIDAGTSSPLPRIALALDQPMWIPIVVIPVTFLLLLFPEGHLPSPRWRWFAWGLAVGMCVTFLAILLSPGPMEESDFADVMNPLGLEPLHEVLSLATVAIITLPIGVLGSLASLVLRFRRSNGIERLQLRWLVTAAATVGILYALALVLSFNSGWGEPSASTPGWLSALQTIAIGSFGLIPIAIGIAVLRYHLFDIDLVINRALLFGAMAIFITAVYVSIVVGVGALVGSRASPLLSAAAAGIVALAFQPARRRAQRLADRLVYGKRATPYEVLSEFSERIGRSYANDELLPRMAQALGEGTAAERVDLWVRFDDELRAEATWPVDAAAPVALVAEEHTEGSTSATSMLEPIHHQGSFLGAVSIEKRPGESITPTEEKLVRDLAAQAGLVMRNVVLAEQLMHTIDELRGSRQRLVAAQDEGRRRIERDLHDGAQQQIVALTIKLRLLGQLLDPDDGRASTLVAELQTDANEALEQLRDLARGIYPPLLADRGLVAALEAQAGKASIPTVVRSDGVDRYAQETEAAVYFCVLEAMTNIAKYAGATQTAISLSQTDGQLTFEVHDDGSGFDTVGMTYGTGLQGMADRLDAIGGTVGVISAPGEGTTIRGSVPARDRLASA
jgi:signal transduction histidine kinase